MKQSQIIPLVLYLAIVFAYLYATTKFQKGWIHRCVPVKGGKLNVVLVTAIFFVVLIIVVKTTM